MWPRLHCFCYPVDRESGVYRVRVLKGWWGGPGCGGRQALLLETVVTIKADDERALMREALRAAADSL